jgi:NAD(P)-dependent dehydrogenase (short-subunit alcohol dehydrogenase family)
MDMQLAHKSVLVTGSTAGIGFAIAALFAEEGAKVVVNGRSEARVKEAAENIRRKHKNAQIVEFAGDLSTKEGADALTKKVPAVDVLVNNLGIYEARPFPEITDEEWSRIFEVNVLSGVRLSRFYLPKMLKQNWGRIVFISSESGINTPVEMIHYGVTKTAQIALARGLAEMTVGTAVTVNSVLVGPTRSEGVDKFVNDMAKSKGTSGDDVEQEFFKSVRPTSLLKRFETAEEVAAMVVYVSSPLASGTNGSALRVEGGVLRSIV